MPKLRESESQRICRDWNALVTYKCKLKRIYTLEQLAKKLNCSRPTASSRSNSPFLIRLGDLLLMCKVLSISSDEMLAVLKGGLNNPCT